MLASKKRLANALCLSRIPLGAAFLVAYSTDDFTRYAVAMAIAVVALLTDIADGRLARRWGIASDSGAILDGLGDKAFYIAVYLVISEYKAAEALLLWLLIVREIALYGLRVIDARRAVNTKRLRWISLAFALLIRLYFLSFFAEGAFLVLGFPVPAVLGFSNVLAYSAALIGLLGLVMTAKSLSEETERERHC
jgi:CDP-diacylglycerol---glycerol-3-phosphate 3-phosphatidyltransferase